MAAYCFSIILLFCGSAWSYNVPSIKYIIIGAINVDTKIYYWVLSKFILLESLQNLHLLCVYFANVIS